MLGTFRTTWKVPIYDGEARASRSSRYGPDHCKSCPLSLDPLSCFFTAAKFRALASSSIGLQVICLLSPRRFHGSRVVFPHERPRYSLLVVLSLKDAVFADGGLRAKEIPEHTMHHFWLKRGLEVPVIRAVALSPRTSGCCTYDS